MDQSGKTKHSVILKHAHNRTCTHLSVGTVQTVHFILLNAICKSMSTFGTKFKLETEFQDWFDIILVEFQPKFIQRHW